MVAASSQAVSQSCNASSNTDLKAVLAEKIPVVQEEVKAFRKQHGNTKIGEITVDMLYGGMRMMASSQRLLSLTLPKVRT